MTTDHSQKPGHGHGQADHGHGGTGLYIKVFLALCVLTSMSFFTVSDFWPFHDTPAVGWVFMMAVSCTKALLVMTFFMHLLWEANWKYVLTIPASMMSVFLVIALVPDVGQRIRSYSEERLIYAADESAEVHGEAHEQHDATDDEAKKHDEHKHDESKKSKAHGETEGS